MNTLLMVLQGDKDMLNQVLSELVSKYPDSIVTIKRDTKEDPELHHLYRK